MTFKEWLNIVADLNDAWPRRNAMGPGFARVWFPAVEQFTEDEVRGAVGVYCLDVDKAAHPPNGAELAHIILRERGELPPEFDTVWIEIMSKVRRMGRFEVPTWSRPEIGHLVEVLGGWSHLCSMRTDQQSVYRGQAARLWETIAKRAIRSGQIPIGGGDIPIDSVPRLVASVRKEIG